MTHTNKTRELVSSTLRTVRMMNRVEAAGLVIDHSSHEVRVSGNTYPVRGILKAAGFRWIASAKVWRFETIRYSNVRFVCGRLSDAKVHRRPAPSLDYAAMCRAYAGR